jgi:hypothetical protein
MPQNNTGTIAIVSPIVGESFYSFSPQDTYAALAEIPTFGVTLQLPADPSDGDRYEFADVDGTCSALNPIILGGNGHNLQGLEVIIFYAPYDAGYVWFDANSSTWVLAGLGGEGAWHQFIITATQTIDAPSTDLFIDIWGGGGAGAQGASGATGATGQAGAGGGGGAIPLYDVHIIVHIGDPLTITPGTQGTGQGGPGGLLGNPGGNSTIHSAFHNTTYVTGVGASGGTTVEGTPSTLSLPGGGPPITSLAASVSNPTATMTAAGQGGYGGTANAVLPLGAAHAGMDSVTGFLGGTGGGTGATNTNAGGFGGGGGGAGPGGPGGVGGGGGAGAASGEGVAGTAGFAPAVIVGSGAGGGGGGAGGNGASAGAAGGTNGPGGSGFVLMRWFA